MKVAVVITRRPDLSLAQFRDYYENKHAPMGIQYFPFDKYVRNYVVAYEPSGLSIDCLMTCEVDLAKSDAAMGFGDVDKLFRADEANFMTLRGEGIDEAGGAFGCHTKRAIGVGVIERHRFGAGPGVDAPGTRKQMLFVSRTAETGEATYFSRLADWVDRVARAAGLPSATIDQVAPGQDDVRFPADTLITVWLGTNGTPDWTGVPQGAVIGAMLSLESWETPPALLAERFGTYKTA